MQAVFSIWPLDFGSFVNFQTKVIPNATEIESETEIEKEAGIESETENKSEFEIENEIENKMGIECETNLFWIDISSAQPPYYVHRTTN